MSKGDHMLISDELSDWIEAHANTPARVGAMVAELVRYWNSGGTQRPPGAVPDDLAELCDVFCGQLDRFRHSVARNGGMTADDIREYNRKRQANARARKAGKPEPYPDLVPPSQMSQMSQPVASVTSATRATNATPCDTCDNPVASQQSQSNASAGAPVRTRKEGFDDDPPISREDAYTVGGAAGMSRQAVDEWFDYYAAAQWRFRAKDDKPMTKAAAVSCLRNWRRRQADFGERRANGTVVGGAQNQSSAIRDCPNQDNLTEAQKQGIAKNGW